MADDMSQMKRSKLFEHMATSPHLWFAEAAGLMRAAYVLWDYHQRRRDNEKRIASGNVGKDALVDISTDRFVSSYMLLAGFAIENAVKGLIISQQEVPANLQCLPNEVLGHDLRKMFATAGIQLDAKDELLIEALHEAIIWKGRYHTPKRVNSIDGTYPWLDYGKMFCHPEDIRGLFNRVVAAYPKNVWEVVAEIAEQFPARSDEWLTYVNKECPQCSP